MRHVADRRGELSVLGEVLSGGDALYSLRYRSGVPLSVGGGLSGNAQGGRQFDFRRDGFVPRNLVRRLRLRPQETGVRLEELNLPMVKTAKCSGRLPQQSGFFAHQQTNLWLPLDLEQAAGAG